MLNSLTVAVVAALISSYCFYTFLARPDGYMMVTIPLATFLIFRYFYLIESDQKVGEKTELVVKDKQMLLGIIAWLLISIFVLYVT